MNPLGNLNHTKPTPNAPLIPKARVTNPYLLLTEKKSLTVDFLNELQIFMCLFVKEETEL